MPKPSYARLLLERLYDEQRAAALELNRLGLDSELSQQVEYVRTPGLPVIERRRAHPNLARALELQKAIDWYDRQILALLTNPSISDYELVEP